jgi:nucleoid-associated protein YgaU
MKSPLLALLQTGVVPPVAFPPDSRYYGSSTLSYTTPGGQQISYLARRFVPQPGAPNFSTVATHTVRRGDRLDLIAAKYLGDPLMYWLICDANGAIRPNELLETPGQTLNITLPQGVPGASNA